jgi:hypothetical protein
MAMAATSTVFRKRRDGGGVLVRPRETPTVVFQNRPAAQTSFNTSIPRSFNTSIPSQPTERDIFLGLKNQRNVSSGLSETAELAISRLMKPMERAMSVGLREAEQLIPLFKQEAAEEKRRYLESYNAYRQAVGALAKALETPFLPVRETLRTAEEAERTNIGRLINAGLSPAMAEAIAKTKSEEQYFNVREQMRQAKINQQIQAANAIGSLIGFSSAPTTALSGLSGLLGGMLNTGVGGYTQALDALAKQKALGLQEKALSQQAEEMMRNFWLKERGLTLQEQEMLRNYWLKERGLAIQAEDLLRNYWLRERGLGLQERGLGLQERALAQDYALQRRALDLQERGINAQIRSQRNAEAMDIFKTLGSFLVLGSLFL